MQRLRRGAPNDADNPTSGRPTEMAQARCASVRWSWTLAVRSTSLS